MFLHPRRSRNTRKRRLLWQLYPSYLLITLVAVVAVGWFAQVSVARFYRQMLREDLRVRAELVQQELDSPISAERADELCRHCRAFGETTSTRVTLMLPSGEVICDSAGDPDSMDNHAGRPEMKEALAGGTGEATRYSDTIEERLMYVAVPIVRDDTLVGVVRTAVPVTAIQETLAGIRWRVLSGGGVIALLAAAVCLVVTRRLGRPLEAMRRGAERFARGELGYQLEVPDSAELAAPAEALNKMAHELRDRIETIERQRNEREAVLRSMAEGVFAVDTEQRVISMNRAAADLLDCDLEKVGQRKLHEVVRNPDLRRFVTRTLSQKSPIEDDLDWHGETPRVLRAHGTPLHDASGAAIGAVVVLNDFTHVRRLENIRRDFVANVSHELKTPITSIKGFVETLQDGAAENPEERERFLQIISRQADRLGAIIEDLLSLSKIEQSEGDADISLQWGRVEDLLRAAVDECGAVAEERQISVRYECPHGLEAKIEPALMEQAVVNLLDNAIKYSEPDHEVVVVAEEGDEEVTISVNDQGCGIEAQHLSRLFERFYRVDKARSRKLGGTGLGLAIVKHIVQVHKGHVSVKSTPGVGSTFTIHLPRA